MSQEIKGKLTKKLDIETGTSKSGKEWKKQSFVIDTGDQYNPEVCFSLFGDEKVKELEKYSVGQELNVSFNVSSREFNGKYYHSLDAWKISVEGGSVSNTAKVEIESDDSGLPF